MQILTIFDKLFSLIDKLSEEFLQKCKKWGINAESIIVSNIEQGL